MKKKLFIICLFLLVLVTGCVKKSVDPTVKEKESERPVAEGTAFAAQELEFYLPEGFQKSPTNGMLGVYEFYTGELKNAGPTGIDYMILVDLMGEDFSFEDYLKTESFAGKNEIELTEKTINDTTWYVGEKDGSYYYYSTFRGYHYDIEIHPSEGEEEFYKSSLKMFEKTLFFEELDTN